jgi:hypothetical protein
MVHLMFSYLTAHEIAPGAACETDEQIAGMSLPGFGLA